jgi:hypothetical protein
MQKTARPHCPDPAEPGETEPLVSSLPFAFVFLQRHDHLQSLPDTLNCRLIDAMGGNRAQGIALAERSHA